MGGFCLVSSGLHSTFLSFFAHFALKPFMKINHNCEYDHMLSSANLPSESLNLEMILGTLDMVPFIGPAPRMSTPRIISHTTEDWRLFSEETER